MARCFTALPGTRRQPGRCSCPANPAPRGGISEMVLPQTVRSALASIARSRMQPVCGRHRRRRSRWRRHGPLRPEPLRAPVLGRTAHRHCNVNHVDPTIKQQVMTPRTLCENPAIPDAQARTLVGRAVSRGAAAMTAL
jgi:hypothetical protein